MLQQLIIETVVRGIPPLTSGNTQPKPISKLVGGDTGPVVGSVVGGRDEVQFVAVGGQWRWRRWGEELTTDATPTRTCPAVNATLDGHPGPLVQPATTPSTRVRVGVEGVHGRHGPTSMKVVTGPGEQGRSRRRGADVRVPVLRTGDEACSAGRTELDGRVKVPCSPARRRLVGRRAVGTAGRH